MMLPASPGSLTEALTVWTTGNPAYSKLGGFYAQRDRLIRNYSHVIIIGLICVCLWGLNARNSQLSATNDRLEKLTNSKDEQINDLRSKNDDLASSVNDLVKAVNQQNAVISQVAEQRAVTAEQNRKLQNEIKRYLTADKSAAAPVDGRAVKRLRDAAKSASGVPNDKAVTFKPAGGADQPVTGASAR